MSKFLHDSDEMLSSPEYGWDAMQSLLDKHLPEAAATKHYKPLYSYLVAASFISIFLFSSLITKDSGRSFLDTIQSNISSHHSLTNNPTLSPEKNDTDVNTTLADNVSPAIKSPINNAAFYSTTKERNNPAYLFALKPVVDNEIEIASTHLTARSPTINDFSNKPDLLINEDLNNTTAVSASKIASKKQRNNQLSLYAGVATNIVAIPKQHIRPYPTAKAQYQLNKKTFVSLGLAVGSVVSTDNRAIGSKVHLNDSNNNIKYYNSVQQFTRLSYADIPLMVGTTIGKKISLQAGMQASVLLKQKSSSTIERYDFQLNRELGLPVNVTALPGGSTEAYPVAARKIDYRFVAGVGYTINKTSLYLNYQYAPERPVKGSNVSGSNNQLVAVGVQFQLK